MQLERTELRAHLARAIGELPERERQILALYYEEELTLAEIGEVIGVVRVARLAAARPRACRGCARRLRESLGLPERQP